MVNTNRGRMVFANYRVERFRVLNGLLAGEGPTPGKRVKIVTD